MKTIQSMDNSPVFITGYQRSGTTLLGNLVDRHPRISVFLESFFIPLFYYIQPIYWPLNKKNNIDRLANAIVSRHSSKLNHLIWNESVSSKVTEKTYAGILDAIMREWAKNKGKERWGDKTPGYISKLHVLHRMYPRARFVHIIRDGRDVWLSANKLGWSNNISGFANDWKTSIKIARHYAERKLTGQYLEVRYEELLGTPEIVLKDVMLFLGEHFSEILLQQEHSNNRNEAFAPWPDINNSIMSENKFKWKQEMSDRDILFFEGQAGELLDDLGYERKFEIIPVKIRIFGKVSVVLDLVTRALSLISRRLRFGIRMVRLRVR